MNHIRRTLAALATLAGTMLAFATAAPAALADHVPPPGGNAGPVSGATRLAPWPKTPLAPAPQVHTIVVGGMPGWQITLIAAGAAVAAAVIAVMLDRARTTRRRATASAA